VQYIHGNWQTNAVTYLGAIVQKLFDSLRVFHINMVNEDYQYVHSVVHWTLGKLKLIKNCWHSLTVSILLHTLKH